MHISQIGLHVRLVGGTSQYNGRLEVTMANGKNGTVCGAQFDANAAKVVCRQLGFHT